MSDETYTIFWSGAKERRGECRSLLGLEPEKLRPAPSLTRAPHLGGRLKTLTAADQLLLDGEDDA